MTIEAYGVFDDLAPDFESIYDFGSCCEWLRWKKYFGSDIDEIRAINYERPLVQTSSRDTAHDRLGHDAARYVGVMRIIQDELNHRRFAGKTVNIHAILGPRHLTGWSPDQRTRDAASWLYQRWASFAHRVYRL